MNIKSKIFVSVLLLTGMISIGANAATCPNASTSVTIPLSGAATVTMYDQNCNILPGTSFTVQETNSAGPQVNATTSPALSEVSGGLNFSANTAVAGSAGTFFIRFTPNGQSTSISWVVGAPVTSVSAGTTTP